MCGLTSSCRIPRAELGSGILNEHKSSGPPPHFLQGRVQGLGSGWSCQQGPDGAFELGGLDLTLGWQGRHEGQAEGPAPGAHSSASRGAWKLRDGLDHWPSRHHHDLFLSLLGDELSHSRPSHVRHSRRPPLRYSCACSIHPPCHLCHPLSCMHSMAAGVSGRQSKHLRQAHCLAPLRQRRLHLFLRCRVRPVM